MHFTAEMSSSLKVGPRRRNVHTGLIRPGSQDPVSKEKLRIRKSPE